MHTLQPQYLTARIGRVKYLQLGRMLDHWTDEDSDEHTELVAVEPYASQTNLDQGGPTSTLTYWVQRTDAIALYHWIEKHKRTKDAQNRDSDVFIKVMFNPEEVLSLDEQIYENLIARNRA